MAFTTATHQSIYVGRYDFGRETYIISRKSKFVVCLLILVTLSHMFALFLLSLALFQRSGLVGPVAFNNDCSVTELTTFVAVLLLCLVGLFS